MIFTSKKIEIIAENIDGHAIALKWGMFNSGYNPNWNHDSMDQLLDIVD